MFVYFYHQQFYRVCQRFKVSATRRPRRARRAVVRPRCHERADGHTHRRAVSGWPQWIARLSTFQAEEAERKRRVEEARRRGQRVGQRPPGVGPDGARATRPREISAGQERGFGLCVNRRKEASEKRRSENAALTMGRFSRPAQSHLTPSCRRYYSLNNGFTQVDAWRSFRSAVNTQSSSSTWDEGKQACTSL